MRTKGSGAHRTGRVRTAVFHAAPLFHGRPCQVGAESPEKAPTWTGQRPRTRRRRWRRRRRQCQVGAESPEKARIWTGRLCTAEVGEESVKNTPTFDVGRRRALQRACTSMWERGKGKGERGEEHGAGTEGGRGEDFVLSPCHLRPVRHPLSPAHERDPFPVLISAKSDAASDRQKNSGHLVQCPEHFYKRLELFFFSTAIYGCSFFICHLIISYSFSKNIVFKIHYIFTARIFRRAKFNHVQAI